MVVRRDDHHAVAALDEFPRQRTAHVGEAPSLGPRRHLRGDEDDGEGPLGLLVLWRRPRGHARHPRGLLHPHRLHPGPLVLNLVKVLEPDARFALAEVGHLHPEDVRAERALGCGGPLHGSSLGDVVRALGKRLGHREEVHVLLELVVRLLQLADLLHDRSGCRGCGSGGTGQRSEHVEVKAGDARWRWIGFERRAMRRGARAIRQRRAPVTRRVSPSTRDNSKARKLNEKIVFLGRMRATARGSKTSRRVQTIVQATHLPRRAHPSSSSPPRRAHSRAARSRASRARHKPRLLRVARSPSPSAPCGGDVRRDGAARARDGGAHLSRPAAGGLGYEVTREFRGSRACLSCAQVRCDRGE